MLTFVTARQVPQNTSKLTYIHTQIYIYTKYIIIYTNLYRYNMILFDSNASLENLLVFVLVPTYNV